MIELGTRGIACVNYLGLMGRLQTPGPGLQREALRGEPSSSLCLRPVADLALNLFPQAEMWILV